MGGSSEDFSVLVLASDLAVVDPRPFLTHREEEEQEQECWHHCSQYLCPNEDFSDLDLLQFFRLQGSDKNANPILRIVGKYYPGQFCSPHLKLLYFVPIPSTFLDFVVGLQVWKRIFVVVIVVFLLSSYSVQIHLYSFS